KIPLCYDDDDDEESSTPLRDIIISELPSCIAITPVLSTKEPKDTLIMGDEHLDTNPLKESNEFIKSSVEKLVPNPSESEDEPDCDPEKEIRLIKKLLYDNSSPCPSKEFIPKNSDAAIKSFSPYHIPVEDSDSLRDEIDLSLTPNDSMPLGIKNDDYDSEGDMLILEELLSNDSLSLLENELLPTQTTLASNQEKSPHRGLKAFQLSSESLMMIYGGNIPILDVPFFHFCPP
nr:hypothetical protein [Tanacetum cinerariifolium]